MGTSRRTSSLLLIGLGAAGCMSQKGNTPGASAEQPAPILSKQAPQQPDVPLVSDGADASQRVLVDSVNDNVTRVSQILRQREQANVLAADIREQREAAALRRAGDAANRADSSNAENEASPSDNDNSPGAIEKLAADFRARMYQRKAAGVETNSATPTVANASEPQTDEWADLGLSAAEPQEDGDYGDAVPARRIQGAISEQTTIERNVPAAPTGKPTPGIARGPGIDPMLAIQEKFLTRVNDDPRNLGAHLELQLARLLRNEPVPAMADLSTLNVEDRELIAAVSDALSNFRSLIRNDPNPLGAEKARPFIEMADRIRARSDLNVQSVNLCTSVKAFGNYEPIENTQFAAGSPTWTVFYCEVDGFLSQLSEKQQWESKLSLELRLYNEAGMQLWRVEPETVVDSSRKRRRDFFIAKRIQLPSNLAPGPYMLKATIRDLQANRVAESTLQVKVVGK